MSNATLEFGGATVPVKLDLGKLATWFEDSMVKTLYVNAEPINKAGTYHASGVLGHNYYAPVPDYVPAPWVEEYTYEKLTELAFEAAAYIEEHGWTQGVYSNAYGNVCAMGALTRVVHNPRAFDALTNEGHRVVGFSIPHWNDAPERTADEVINMWLEVAAIFEARALGQPV